MLQEFPQGVAKGPSGRLGQILTPSIRGKTEHTIANGGRLPCQKERMQQSVTTGSKNQILLTFRCVGGQSGERIRTVAPRKDGTGWYLAGCNCRGRGWNHGFWEMLKLLKLLKMTTMKILTRNEESPKYQRATNGHAGGIPQLLQQLGAIDGTAFGVSLWTVLPRRFQQT